MSQSADPSPRPTRARYIAVAFLVAMSFVLYLDRICFSQAVSDIKKDLDLDDKHISLAMMAFTLAYGLFEVPTGRWGDVFGARRILTRIVICWSAFTAVTGLCWNLGSMMVVRFLFGAGEAGAYPNAVRVINTWVPAHERGRMRGLFMAGSLFGGACAPVLAAPLIHFLGWRGMFFVFAAFGIVWAAAFWWWFRDHPADHPSVNEAELAYIGTALTGRSVHEPIPWHTVFRIPAIWLLGTITSLTSFNSYLYFSWYPFYLKQAWNLDQFASSGLASLPLAGAGLGVLYGGWISDFLERRGYGRLHGGKRYCIATFVLATVFLYLSTQTEYAWLSALCAGLSSMTMMSQLPTWWAFAIEISGKHLGSLFGLMNGLGVVGAMSSQGYFGFYADYRKDQGFTGSAQYDSIFILYGVALISGGILWCFVDVSRKIDK